ncbi:MAG: thioredoxin family protein [Candidatus Levybacteria bacterium]|nr:thioredoxin family protein [Candidatus Levybacteria bacterium]
MKNPVVILVVIAVVVVFGIGAYTFSQNSSQSDSMMKKDEAMMSKEDTSMEPTGVMMDDKLTNSRYIQYSKSALESALSTRRVLFFYASWCPTCKPADASFTANVSKIPEDVTLIRVNYNDPETDQEEKDLAKKYGITYQHTFVQIDSTGKEVAKWNGGQIDELLSHIK